MRKGHLNKMLLLGLEETVELLIENGANVNATNVYNETALILAINSGNCYTNE